MAKKTKKVDQVNETKELETETNLTIVENMVIKEQLIDFTEAISTEEPVVDIPVEKVVEIEKPKRTVDSLNRNEYRIYLLTGKIPE